jgi:hypothetical protein
MSTEVGHQAYVRRTKNHVSLSFNPKDALVGAGEGDRLPYVLNFITIER